MVQDGNHVLLGDGSDDPTRLEYSIASCCSQAWEREEGVREDEELGK